MGDRGQRVMVAVVELGLGLGGERSARARSGSMREEKVAARRASESGSGGVRRGSGPW